MNISEFKGRYVAANYRYAAIYAQMECLHVELVALQENFLMESKKLLEAQRALSVDLEQEAAQREAKRKELVERFKQGLHTSSTEQVKVQPEPEPELVPELVLPEPDLVPELKDDHHYPFEEVYRDHKIVYRQRVRSHFVEGILRTRTMYEACVLSIHVRLERCSLEKARQVIQEKIDSRTNYA